MKNLFLPWLLLALPMWAQERLTPPPTQILLPSDTTLTAGRTAEKLEADSSQIQLPDVVVMGQNKSLRQVDQKKVGKGEGPRLLQPGEAYGPLSSWLRRSNEKQGIEDFPFRLQKTWLVLQAGSYSTLESRLGHWHKLRNGQIHGYGWYDHSNGQYNQSGYQQGGIAGKWEYQLSAMVKTQVQARYDRFGRDLHGAAYQQTERSGGRGGVALQMSVDPRPLTSLRANLEIEGISLNSDTAGVRLDASDDFSYNLAFVGQQVWSQWQVSLHGRVLRENYETMHDSTSDLATLSELGVEALYPFSRQIQLSLGLDFQAMSADSSFSRQKLAPFGRIRFSPNDRFGVALYGHSGLQYQSFMQRCQENPYLSHRFRMAPEESRFTLRLESEVLLIQGTHLSLMLGKNWMDRLLYWQSDPTSGLFTLDSGTGSLSEIHLGISSALSRNSSVVFQATAYGDRLDQKADSTGTLHMPYRPAWQLKVRGRQLLGGRWALTAEAEYWGKRYPQAQSGQRLPDFALVRAGVQKEISRTITLWLTLQNITDSRYVFWERYPETGFSLHGGLRAQF